MLHTVMSHALIAQLMYWRIKTHKDIKKYSKPKLNHTFENCLLPEYPAANSLDSGIESVSRIHIMNWINFVWGPRAGIIKPLFK